LSACAAPYYVYGGQRSLLTNGVDCRYPLSAFTLLRSMHLYDFHLLPSRLTVPTSAKDVWLKEVVVWSVVASVVIALQIYFAGWSV
jgi:hypothetical protein